MAEPTSAIQTQPTPIPIFKGDGYEYWCIRMKTILRSRDLWDLVETGVDETDKDQTRLKAAVKKDAHAMAIIQQAVHDQLFSRIAGATSAKETWDILRMEFQGDEKVKAVKLQGLRREFENLFMKEDELVGDYFSRVMAIVSQKRSYGETVSDQIIVEKVLRSLSPRFDFIVPTIEVSTDMSTLTPVKLMGALQSQEARLNSRSKERGEKVEEQALQVVQNNRPVFGSTSPRGRGRGSPRGRGRGRIPDRSKVPQCHVCKKFGHLKRDCWYNDDNQAQVVTAEEPAVEPTAQETEEEQPNLFMMFTEEMDEHSSRLWFLDSGCSNHMTGVKESFTNLDESFAVDVNLGDKKKLRVVGKGTVRINMANGSFRLLEDVYYIPRLEYNLLSVGQLMKKGYSIIFNDGKCVITNKRTGVDLLTIKVAKNNMFVLDASRIDHSQFHAHVCKNDEAHLWHLRWEWLDDKTSAGLDNSALQDPFPLMIESDISSNGDHLPSVHASTPNTYENIDMSQNLSSPSSHQSNSPFPQSTPTYDTTHSPDNSTSPSLNTYSNPMSTTNVTSPNVSQELENAASPPQNSDDGPSRRQRKPPSWLHDFESGEGLSDEEAQFLTLTSTDPSTFQEAADKQEWQKAMMSELEAIKKHDTWELVTLPKGKNVVGLKWIFKTKLGVDGKIVKHKARLVVKGYSQLHGIDYQETFAPVARFETIRVVISVAAQRGWELHQLDVKTAFLNGELSEEIYVNQPEGFVKKGDEDKVYRLKKALYGLKQAPRAWYSRIDGYFSQHGYVRSINEPNLYVKKVNNDFIYVCLYVDDIVYTSSSAKLIKEFKACMEQEFEMSDMGLLKLFLGLEVNQTPKGVFLSQKKYAKSLVSKFGMDGCKAEVTPMNANEKLFLDDKADKVDEVMFRSLVGGLIYLTHTRPDLAYSVSLISRFMQSPSKLHLGAAKRILRYVASTIGFGIWYERGVPVQLLGYTDSDWASSIDDRKSVSASVFNLGSGAVTWSSKKQNTVALSSTEAEYVASSAATSQAVWLRRILCDLGLVQESPTVIFCDNHSAINLSRNPVLHGRTKHIEIKHHYVRDMVAQQEISLEYCGTEMQVADVLTKALGREKFIRFRMLLGVEYFEARGDDGNAPKMTVESG
ncbi:putative RNA-directed DNA polymerase [Helianthus annuus]|nr:putative RNA-directed DNA polymerase [Helianthus annuus]KAJ0456978.1 putative RNA-directed DNA polymerase [Helianthus annuus]KAJ0649643.1 putative RNA-directed DNA polymerase [Helianthus annuus]